MTEIKIEYLPVTVLTPYKKNARAHGKEDVSKIAMSIEKYGMNDPIGIWGDKNIIVEGHGRMLACIKLGMDTVPVIRLDHLTDEQRREYAIMHNKTAELSAWDIDLLSEEISLLPGLDDFGIDWKLPTVEELDAVEDDYDGELPEQPKSKLGDIYQLGRHRLMCGSSTDPAQVEALMDGRQADMLLTDPPYGVDYVGKTKDALKIDNDKLQGENFLHFLADAFQAANDVMKPGAVFYISHADSKGLTFRMACEMVGWQVRECLVWVKNSIVMGRMDYHYQHEPILYGWREGSGHLWASDRKQSTVLHFDKPARNDIHPTMKPVKLWDYLMKNNTKGGDIVLDLFGGSGTTIIAAEQNGRCGYCMELDTRYVDAIINRWEEFTGQKAELISEV